MFNLDKFIADSVTFRPVSMFAADIEANKEVRGSVNSATGCETIRAACGRTNNTN